MYRNILILFHGIGLLGLVLQTVTASTLLEEIVVTAQKRQESTQDVGIAITAFSADQIRELGFTDSTKVAAMSPGVQVNQPNGLSSWSFSIRGVTQSDFSDHQESPVSVYVDEVYVSQMGSVGFQLFDMERVETLRGPQGTLFGRNATGGLLHFVTRKPSDEFSAYAEVTYGDYDLVTFEGAVGGSIAESVSARASIKTNRHDGYIDNNTGPDGNDQENYAGRIQLLFELGNSAEFLLNVRGAKNDYDTPQFWKNAPAAIGPTGVGVFTAAGDVAGDVHEGSWNLTGGWGLDTYGISGTLKWDFDNFTLTAITDYSDLEKDYLADTDEGPLALLHFGMADEVQQFSQEVRLSSTSSGPVNWVAGAYFLDIDGDYSATFVAPFTLAFLGFAPFNTVFNEFSTETQSWAIFGQIEYELAPDWTLTAGVRWTHEDKEHDYANNLGTIASENPLDAATGLLSIGAFNKSLNGEQAEIDEGMWSGKIALNWQPTDDLLYYVSWNRGIKAGAFNAPVFALPANEMRFDEEVLNAYEIGMKSTLFEKRLRLNAAVFYYDYTDIQAFQLEGFTQVVRNKDGDSKGVEIEIAASPMENLDLLFGVSYLDATIDDVSAGLAVINAQPQMAPKWNVSGLARYQWPAFNGTMAIQGDFTHLSNHQFDIASSELVKQDGYVIGNARLSYLTQDERWEVAAFVKNIEDEAYATWAYDLSAFTGVVEKIYGNPRWWGLSLRYAIN